jgi:TonB family protein
MIAAVLIALLSAAPPAPSGNPAEWITAEDYPASEIRNDITGVAGFILDIDEMGKVVGCRITQSSGSDVLDATTCALMKARASFTPARNEKGKGISGTYSSRVRWKIPEIPPQPLSAARHTIAFFVDVDEKGVVERCEIEKSSDDILPESGPCADYPVGRKVGALTTEDGKAVKVRMTFRASQDAQPR